MLVIKGVQVMLTTTIEIKNINHETTFRNIYPAISGKVMEWKTKNLIIRLLQQLGDASLPILISLLYQLPESTKNELLVRVLNSYAPVLKDKLNEELKEDEWGKCFRVGSLSVDRQTVEQQDSIIFSIRHIEVDYHALLNHNRVSNALNKHLGMFLPLAKPVANLAVAIAPNTLERKGLEYLWDEESKLRLIDLIKNALNKYGVEIELDDMQLMQDEKIIEDIIEVKQPLILTDEMETDIIAALANYLRSKVSDDIVPDK